MRRILFVDDKPKVLEELKVVMRPQQEKWEMAFVAGSEAALAMLEATPFDVIVTDPKLAGVKKNSLLDCVRERFSGVVRIALLEQSDTSLLAAPVAHQFLTKPCEPSELRVAVERSCKLRDLLNDEFINRAVGSMSDLPSLPKVYEKLTRALRNPNISLNKIAKIVEQDVAISAKLLQLANSALFGTVQDMNTVHMAVSYMGLDVIQHMVLSLEVFRSFEGLGQIEGFSLEATQEHAQLTAKIAVRLLPAKYLADTAIVAALLHDVGKLVLASKMPGRFKRCLEASREQNRPLYQVEEELGGITHAEIGAYLLGLWGLPYSVAEAVAHHHKPKRVPHQSFDAVGAVYVANLLAHAHAPGPKASRDVEDPIDMEYLQKLGVADQLKEWQAMAKLMARPQQSASEQQKADGKKSVLKCTG
ncbi:MAG: HDOD domain-containing protein [Acidobacteria bacterium]|nr:HDOD domain-containing protein [Acidobacteriota bacterium]